MTNKEMKESLVYVKDVQSSNIRAKLFAEYPIIYMMAESYYNVLKMFSDESFDDVAELFYEFVTGTSIRTVMNYNKVFAELKLDENNMTFDACIYRRDWSIIGGIYQIQYPEIKVCI